LLALSPIGNLPSLPVAATVSSPLMELKQTLPVMVPDKFLESVFWSDEGIEDIFPVPYDINV
jgi:hypothetical protein